MAELVSILIPVYNCERWVGDAVRSALAQTWENKEVIVLDDASTDGSWRALQPWKDKVRLERAGKNGGQNVSRNRLTALSRGEWLVYLDADDELAPDAAANKMRCSANAGAVYGSMETHHYEGSTLTGSSVDRAVEFADPLVAAFLWKYPNTSSLLFRRSALLGVGGWNEAIQNCTDYDLYFRLLLADKAFAPAPDSISIYRQWSEKQAVYQAPKRKVTTRLGVMWRAVEELERAGRMNEARRDAFSNAALAVVRSLYALAPEEALREHARLRAWNRDLAPSRMHFPAAYCAGYRLLGFQGAEMLAKATRFLRPAPG